MVQKSASSCLQGAHSLVEPKARSARAGARASPGRPCLMQLQSAFWGSLWSLTRKVGCREDVCSQHWSCYLVGIYILTPKEARLGI